MVKLNRILICTFILSTSVSQGIWAQQQLTDPMRPQRYQAPQKSAPIKTQKAVKTDTWKLSTVLTSADRKVALINGKPFQIGDLLEGYRIVEIRSDRVVLKNDKSKVLLRRSGTGLRKDVR